MPRLTAPAASGRVMEHAGFVYDHDDVAHNFDGTAVAVRCYALTRADWQRQTR